MRPKREARYVDNGQGGVPRLALPLRVSINLQLRIARRAQDMGVTVNEYVLACVKRDLEREAQ